MVSARRIRKSLSNSIFSSRLCEVFQLFNLLAALLILFSWRLSRTDPAHLSSLLDFFQLESDPLPQGSVVVIVELYLFLPAHHPVVHQIGEHFGVVLLRPSAILPDLLIKRHF